MATRYYTNLGVIDEQAWDTRVVGVSTTVYSKTGVALHRSTWSPTASASVSQISGAKIQLPEYNCDTQDLWIRADLYLNTATGIYPFDILLFSTQHSSQLAIAEVRHTTKTNRHYEAGPTGVSGSVTFPKNQIFTLVANYLHASNSIKLYINGVLVSAGPTVSPKQWDGVVLHVGYSSYLSNIIIADYDVSNETLVPDGEDVTLLGDTRRIIALGEVLAGDTLRELAPGAVLLGDTRRATTENETLTGDTQRTLTPGAVILGDTRRAVSSDAIITGDTRRTIAGRARLLGDTRREIRSSEDDPGASRFIHVYKGGVTEGGRDGTEVSYDGKGTNPITFTLDAAAAQSRTQAVAVRCDMGWRTGGDVIITFTGASAGKWSVCATENGTYGDRLIIQRQIGAANALFYVRAKAEQSETSGTDTTVRMSMAYTVIPAAM